VQLEPANVLRCCRVRRSLQRRCELLAAANIARRRPWPILPEPAGCRGWVELTTRPPEHGIISRRCCTIRLISVASASKAAFFSL
jgi:hypothetical protein